MARDVNRYTRFQGAIPPAELIKAEVAVIGCGAVGRNVVRQLATMGVGTISVVDFDKVSSENLGCQGWAPAEIGKNKVDAMAEMVRYFNPDCDYFGEPNKYSPEMIENVDYVFCCVDNMEVRKEVFELAQHKRLFVEARMGLETARVFYVSPAEKLSSRYWLKEWFPTSEGEPDKCSEKATIYCADAVSSLMVAGFTRTLRGFNNPLMAELNMVASLCRAVWPMDFMSEMPKCLSDEEILKRLSLIKETAGSKTSKCGYNPCQRAKLLADGGGFIPAGKDVYLDDETGYRFCSPACAAKMRFQVMGDKFTPEELGYDEHWVDTAFPGSMSFITDRGCNWCDDTPAQPGHYLSFEGDLKLFCSESCEKAYAKEYNVDGINDDDSDDDN